MKALAIYIHWPFCASLCPYCDFNVHIKRDISAADFFDGIKAELALLAETLGRRKITSVFFGGGTPSLMPPDLAADILAAISNFFIMDEKAEITLEANPEDAEKNIFQAFYDSGINRLSLGVQALDDEALVFLGRKHNALKARQAIELAQEIFPQTSFDLISARPGQNEALWKKELQTALMFAPAHISIYQLSCPKGTSFHRRQRQGCLVLPDDDLAARLYELTNDLCQNAGLMRYEIANHAKPGHEARHNLAYWHYHDYAGLGCGAHGRLNLGRLNLTGNYFAATCTPRKPKAWLDSAKKNDFFTHYQCRNLSPKTRAEEMMMMGLRLAEGISLKRYQAIAGTGLDEKRLTALLTAGFVRRQSGRVFCTPQGALVLDSIIAELIQ